MKALSRLMFPQNARKPNKPLKYIVVQDMHIVNAICIGNFGTNIVNMPLDSLAYKNNSHSEIGGSWMTCARESIWLGRWEIPLGKCIPKFRMNISDHDLFYVYMITYEQNKYSNLAYLPINCSHGLVEHCHHCGNIPRLLLMPWQRLLPQCNSPCVLLCGLC